VYVDIFAGVIQQWMIPGSAANPVGISPPHHRLVARQDSSGTTAAFTNISLQLAPAMGVGKLIDWPKGRCSRRMRVAGRIKTAKDRSATSSLVAQRLGLRMAALQNKAGSFITPTARSGEIALSGRVAEVKELDASVADPAASGAYPITTYSWMFLYPRYADHPKGKAIRDFAEWALSQQAQNYGAQLGYLPLSADVTALGSQALAGLVY
jgi:phosphate transport system substrate-binding protein